jgi:hypothetical protein
MTDYDNCEATGGIWISREIRSTRRKPAPLSFCPSQIPHVLNRAGTRATAVRIRRLTAWAMAWSLLVVPPKVIRVINENQPPRRLVPAEQESILSTLVPYDKYRWHVSGNMSLFVCLSGSLRNCHAVWSNMIWARAINHINYIPSSDGWDELKCELITGRWHCYAAIAISDWSKQAAISIVQQQ